MPVDRLKSNHSSGARLLAMLALGCALVLQCIGARTDSQTTDEGAHLAAGLSYWRTNDFRLNPEHPALTKLLAAAPLIPFRQLQPTADSALWANRDQWSIGRMLLYSQLDPRRETPWILWLARLPIVLVWLCLGWIVWRWAEERTSAWGGAVATVLYAFDPTMLGHGHLITTDLGVAAGMTATFWVAAKLVQRPSWRWVASVGLVFSLTQLTKFTALVLWPLLFAVLAVAAATARTGWNWSWWRRTLLATVTIGAITTWSVYGLEVQSARADPGVHRLWAGRDALAISRELTTMPPLIQRVVSVTEPGSGLRRMLVSMSRLPIPAYSYWRGIGSTISHNAHGHPAYLLGRRSQHGWWYYFPVAILVKTPLPVLALGLVLAFAVWRRRRVLGSPRHLLLIVPMLGFLLWSLSSQINIGVRHVLPVYPLFCISAASLVRLGARRWQRWALGLAVASLPIITWAAWPHTIGYFNALAGGTRGGHRVLLDSNLDWNQDLWRLRDELDRRSTPPARIALFGTVPAEVIHPHPGTVPTDSLVAIAGPPRGLVIVSEGLLYDDRLHFLWLRSLRPTRAIGASILVYDLP